MKVFGATCRTSAKDDRGELWPSISTTSWPWRKWKPWKVVKKKYLKKFKFMFCNFHNSSTGVKIGSFMPQGKFL